MEKRRLNRVLKFLSVLSSFIVFITLFVNVRTKIKFDREQVVNLGQAKEDEKKFNLQQEQAYMQIVINEIKCSKNNQYEIELYNPSPVPVNLEDYFIKYNNKSLQLDFKNKKLIESHNYYVTSIKLDNEMSESHTFSLFYKDSLLDTLQFYGIAAEESFARLGDGSIEVGYFSSTIGKSNNGGKTIYKEYPVLNHMSGFYSEYFDLEIIVKPGMRVYYTLDGSQPTKNSNIYDGKIEITDASVNENKLSARTDINIYGITVPRIKVDKATIVRAIAIDVDGNQSEEIIASYMVMFDKKSKYDDLPLISIITDESYLFDYWAGIYVNGYVYDESLVTTGRIWNGANYWKDWLVDAYIQYFEPSEILGYESNIKLSTYKQDNLNYFQKSLKLTNFVEKNNTSSLAEFTDKSNNCIVLSSGSEDYVLKLRSRLIHELANNCNVATHKYKLCNVLINGEYWGAYNIQDEYDEIYLENRYGINASNIILARGINLIGSENAEGIDELLSFVLNNDLSQSDKYNRFCNMVDIDSVIDYYAINLYNGNIGLTDRDMWLWRSKETSSNTYEDGKWRICLNKLDGVASLDELENYKINTLLGISQEDNLILNALLANKRFLEDLLEKVTSLSIDNYNYDNISLLIENYVQMYEEQMIACSKRFNYTIDNAIYAQYITVLKDFYQHRNEYIIRYIKQYNETMSNK